MSNAWIVELDPEEMTEGRTPLSLNTGAIKIKQDGINWGQAQITAFKAQQQRWGESVLGFRVPNRIVELPLGLGMQIGGTIASEEEARSKLQQKVALIQRENGVLKRQREGSEATYADIVNATLTIPDVWGATAGVEPNTILTLECLPDFYEASTELDAITGEGEIVAVLEQQGTAAVVGGDYPARAWLEITNTSETDYRGLIWGLRSRFYDEAATAALSINASKMTPINGAIKEAHTGAYEGEWVRLAEPVLEAWNPLLKTDLAATEEPLTHVGSYKVWVRAYGTEGQRVRLSWSLDDATVPTANQAATLPGSEAFYLLDLGNIMLERSPVGEHWWRGFIEAYGGETGPGRWAFSADRLRFQPLDESAGTLRAVQSPSAGLISAGAVKGTAENDSTVHSGTAWASSPHGWVAKSSSTEGLAWTMTGISLTSGVTPEGFEVRVHVENGIGATWHAQLLRKGVAVGSALTQYAAAGARTLTLGGTSELWGAEWTAAEVNEAGLGVALWATANESTTLVVSGTPAFSVYGAFSGFAKTTDAVCYAGRKAQMRWDGAYREDTSSGSYVKVSRVRGDFLRLPPSGTENRKVELLVIPSAGNLESEADSSIDKIEAQMVYEPTTLGRS